MNIRPLIPAVLAIALTGCAANGDPRDPLEPMNRAIHGFNEGFDRMLLKPVAQAYSTVLPSFAQTGVRNFFSNLDDVTVLANDILQFKLEQGSRDFMRLAVNSTFGLFGLLDVAGEMGLQKHNEDFGQTLARIKELHKAAQETMKLRNDLDALERSARRGRGLLCV